MVLGGSLVSLAAVSSWSSDWSAVGTGGSCPGQITVEEHPGEKRNPIGGGDGAAFAGYGANGEPGCRGAERGLQRDPVSHGADESRRRGGERGADRDSAKPPLDTLRLRLFGPVRRGGRNFPEGPVTDGIEEPNGKAGGQRRVLVDPKPAPRIGEHPPDHAGVHAKGSGKSLV